MIRLCEEFNCHTHVVFYLPLIPSNRSLKQTKKAATNSGDRQHYLYFNAEDIKEVKHNLNAPRQ
jgi:hypothetical protein